MDRNGQRVSHIEALDHALSQALSASNAHLQTPQFYLTQLKSLRDEVEAVASSNLSQVQHCQERLWSAHNRLRAYFKKRLATLRSQNPARPVETRKWIKNYLEFLKDGQRWYRSYITTLNRLYFCFPQLSPITGLLGTQAGHDEAAKEEVFRACYKSLISLGDMCRWRAAEKLDKEPTWGPAIGYYDLAASFKPTSGTAFQQRAMIEISHKKHLRAVYFLYRANMVAEPDDNALPNLLVEMKSLLKKWETDELSPHLTAKDVDGRRKALTAWFLRLHSLLFQNESFKGHDQLETEVVTRFEHELRQFDSPTNFFTTLVTINMAAERTTLVRMNRASPDQHASFLQMFGHYQRLNIAMFSKLLNVWIGELKSIPVKSVTSEQDLLNNSHLNAIMAQALPCLRICSQWLLSNYPSLSENVTTIPRAIVIQFWNLYADALALTAARYPKQYLIAVPYMLEEEADLIGFEPLESHLQNRKYVKIWQHDDGSPKARPPPTAGGLSASGEGLGRILALQVDGRRLADEGTPVSLANNQFRSQYDVRPVSKNLHVRSTSNHIDTTANAVPARPYPPAYPQPQLLDTPLQSPRPPMTPAEQDARAMHMVDELVGPDASPRTSTRPIGGLEDYGQVISSGPTPTTNTPWTPTPPGTKSARANRPTVHMPSGLPQHAGMIEAMHSPFLLGNSMWSTGGRIGTIGTPPNGQGSGRQ